MATRRDPWNSSWQDYGASTPRRVDDGIATRKKRGAMAETWWSSRLVQLLATYGLGGRMERGRRYARQGQLVSFDVQPGVVLARVQGSRPEPYAVRVHFAPLTAEEWRAVQDEIESTLHVPARLLAGEVPPELEEIFDDAEVDLLPRHWADLTAACSCPDWGNPCKHIAAVLYVLADRLDDDPWLLLLWRGRTRDEVLAHLGGHRAPREEIAPWWPLVPGAPLPADAGHRDPWTDADPAAALVRLGPLTVAVRGTPVTDLLRRAYDVLLSADASVES
jgi:hypothetical protein